MGDGFTEQIDPHAFDDQLGGDVRALIDHDTRLVLGQLNSMVFSPTVSIGSPFTRGLYDLPMPSGGSTKGADKAGAQSLAVSVNVDGKAMAKAVFPHIDTLQGTAAARNNA